MHLFSKILSLSLMLICMGIGCASRSVQMDSLLADAVDLRPARIVNDVGFIDQTKGFCGPATLTMALQYQGRLVSVEDVASQVYTPASGGSFPVDMVSASRRHGMVAISVKSLSQLVDEVAAGNPVMVFENLSVGWAPQWHFALVVGYDLSSRELIVHSGHTAYERVDMKYFDRSWRLANYWGQVVLSPQKLSATGSETDHLTAAVGLESAQKYPEAMASYRSILKKWPNSLVARIGIANIAFQNGDRLDAIAHLLRAVKLHPESKAAQHNLKVATNVNANQEIR